MYNLDENGQLLAEAKSDTLVVAWGRFNPPTLGHELVINKVASEAKSRNADYTIFPTKSHDPKKNPLSFREKVKFMRKLFAKHSRNISADAKVTTVLKLAESLQF